MNQSQMITALKKVVTKKKEQQPYAVVDRMMSNDWKPFFRWADSESRVFQGNFETEEAAIRAIPFKFKKIIVQYRDAKGNEVNKTISRP